MRDERQGHGHEEKSGCHSVAVHKVVDSTTFCITRPESNLSGDDGRCFPRLIPLAQPAIGVGLNQAEHLFVLESTVHGIPITITVTVTGRNRRMKREYEKCERRPSIAPLPEFVLDQIRLLELGCDKNPETE